VSTLPNPGSISPGACPPVTSPTMAHVMTDTFLSDDSFTMAAYRIDPTDPGQIELTPLVE